ncbi:MAG: hypothetical protein D3910_01260 [Candidatus Electrothrix sp. ATG2]|nr:hypothetical protein [Candidatus Electrothrix sp. ATG2]
MQVDDYPVNLVITSKEVLKNLTVGINRPDRDYVTWVLVNAVPDFPPEGDIIQVIVTFMDITKRRVVEAERKKIIKELELALAEVQTLRGILPICSFCKKIRNDKGSYERVESYIHKLAGADFSHTVCPDCLKKHYPEEYQLLS